MIGLLTGVPGVIDVIVRNGAVEKKIDERLGDQAERIDRAEKEKREKRKAGCRRRVRWEG